jgi:hypothetical protein
MQDADCNYFLTAPQSVEYGLVDEALSRRGQFAVKYSFEVQGFAFSLVCMLM